LRGAAPIPVLAREKREKDIGQTVLKGAEKG
jgi:hypothetical protein